MTAYTGNPISSTLLNKTNMENVEIKSKYDRSLDHVLTSFYSTNKTKHFSAEPVVISQPLPHMQMVYEAQDFNSII